MIGRNTLFVLNLSLDILDGVRSLNLEGDGLASEGLHEDLHTTAQSENEVDGGLLLDVVVGEGSAVIQLLATEDKSLLIRGDALLVLDLLFNVFY